MSSISKNRIATDLKGVSMEHYKVSIEYRVSKNTKVISQDLKKKKKKKLWYSSCMAGREWWKIAAHDKECKNIDPKDKITIC